MLCSKTASSAWARHCVIFAIIIALEKKRNPNLSVQSEIKSIFIIFFFNFLFSLLITPIVVIIYQFLQKKIGKKNREDNE